MSKETRCRREHSDLLRICAVLGICLMLAMPLTGISPNMDYGVYAAPGGDVTSQVVYFDANGVSVALILRRIPVLMKPMITSMVRTTLR